MPEVLFAIPGDLATPTGGYRYARCIIDELAKLGWNVRLLALPGDFPAPSAASLRTTAQLLEATPDDALILFDGLAYGALPADVLDDAPRRYVALVHHPLALETGLAPERAAALAVMERETLARAMRVVATSRPTADLLMRDFGVPGSRLSIAEPGTEAAPRAHGGSSTPRLLSVGSITPRKGFDTLVAALREIGGLDWTCRIAGSMDRDLDCTARLKDDIARAGLSERIALLGTLAEEQLAAEYDAASLFVLPSHFEGYGMVFAEAIARGLPIVACDGGAVTTTVPADVGVFVAPGDAPALAGKLRWLLANPAEIAQRADAAWRHAEKLPRWHETARKIADALEQAST